jgi:hypothetical protein
MKKIIIFCFLLPLIGFAQQKNTTRSSKYKVHLSNSMDSFSYSVGMIIAGQMADQGITGLNYKALNRAFEDVFKVVIHWSLPSKPMQPFKKR